MVSVNHRKAIRNLQRGTQVPCEKKLAPILVHQYRHWFEITICDFSGDVAGLRVGGATLSKVRVAGTLDVTELTQES